MSAGREVGGHQARAQAQQGASSRKGVLIIMESWSHLGYLSKITEYTEHKEYKECKEYKRSAAVADYDLQCKQRMRGHPIHL